MNIPSKITNISKKALPPLNVYTFPLTEGRNVPLMGVHFISGLDMQWLIATMVKFDIKIELILTAT